MGSGLVKEAQQATVAVHSDEDKDKNERKSIIERQLSIMSRYLGFSTATSDERSEQRQLICIGAWKSISNTIHRYSNGQTLRGTELFCKMFLSNLVANDISDDKALFNAFKPLPKSHNFNSAAMLKRIVKYLLSIRHESRNAKQNLRALGRSHARIKVERKEFDVFTISFIEALIVFPGIHMSAEIIDAWASLIRFAVDQMCFDTIVFKDHCTLVDTRESKLSVEIPTFELDVSVSTTAPSNAFTAFSNTASVSADLYVGSDKLQFSDNMHSFANFSAMNQQEDMLVSVE